MTQDDESQAQRPQLNAMLALIGPEEKENVFATVDGEDDEEHDESRLRRFWVISQEVDSGPSAIVAFVDSIDRVAIATKFAVAVVSDRPTSALSRLDHDDMLHGVSVSVAAIAAKRASAFCSNLHHPPADCSSRL